MALLLLQRPTQEIFGDSCFHFQEKGTVKKTAVFIAMHMERFNEKDYEVKELEFLKHLFVIFNQTLRKPWSISFVQKEEGTTYGVGEMLYEVLTDYYSIRLYKTDCKNRKRAKIVLEATFPDQNPLGDKWEWIEKHIPEDPTILKRSEHATLAGVEYERIADAKSMHIYDVNWEFVL